VETLIKAGVVRPKALVKILGQGTVSRPMRVSAHGFSKSAEAAITAAGGTVERVPLPYAQGRPPAAGNALMNR
jgi:large subunit ribosomal protein L15